MKFQLLITAAAMATALSAQTASAPPAKAPTGYTDTPLIPGSKWRVHDDARPRPPVITPGTFSTTDVPGKPPSDAVVLFDGKNLDAWRTASGEPAKWKVEDGYLEVVPGAGSIMTRAEFGDSQLHIEWRAPSPPKGDSQGRGNSGIFLMGLYETQVLDCYHNLTYADGQAGAVYGQSPPLVNACRPPGEWQTYDIVFHRPRFEAEGGLTSPARMTILLNGVLIQDNVVLTGPTAHKERPPYARHADRLPLMLQDHGNPVRFRNVWVREIP